MSLLDCNGPARPIVVSLWNAGRCQVCGCTEQKPCAFHHTRALWWVDYEHTVCAAPRCFKIYPRILRARRLHPFTVNSADPMHRLLELVDTLHELDKLPPGAFRFLYTFDCLVQLNEHLAENCFPVNHGDTSTKTRE